MGAAKGDINGFSEQFSERRIKVNPRDWEKESKNWECDRIVKEIAGEHRQGGWDCGDDPRIDV